MKDLMNLWEKFSAALNWLGNSWTGQHHPPDCPPPTAGSGFPVPVNPRFPNEGAAEAKPDVEGQPFSLIP